MVRAQELHVALSELRCSSLLLVRYLLCAQVPQHSAPESLLPRGQGTVLALDLENEPMPTCQEASGKLCLPSVPVSLVVEHGPLTAALGQASL